MAADYAYPAFFLLVGVLFVIVNIDVLSRLIRPSAPNPDKLSTYECGEEPIGQGWIRFHVRYYLYALVYIVFAVEVVFLFPWAVVFKSLGLFAFIEMMIFIAILLVGVLFVIVNIDVLSRLIRPSAPNPDKLSTYECGEEPIGQGWIRFHVRYYLYALVYIVFAVEVVFLFPWAVVFKSLGLFAFIEMMIFIAILLVGFAYAWAKGALEWV